LAVDKNDEKYDGLRVFLNDTIITLEKGIS
jgi:hypothetical protein